MQTLVLGFRCHQGKRDVITHDYQMNVVTECSAGNVRRDKIFNTGPKYRREIVKKNLQLVFTKCQPNQNQSRKIVLSPQFFVIVWNGWNSKKI